MPRITAIEAQKRNPKRSSIFVDDEFFLGVDAEVVFQLKLKAGQDVDPAKLERLAQAADEIRGREMALRLLDHRPRTRRELTRRLTDEGLAPQVVARILDRLEEVKLLDDEAFARALVKEQIGKGTVGADRVRAELAKHGVPRDVAQAVLAEEGRGGEPERCLEVAQHRAASYRKLAPEQARRRLAGYLARHGFRSEDIRRAVLATLPRSSRSGQRSN